MKKITAIVFIAFLSLSSFSQSAKDLWDESIDKFNDQDYVGALVTLNKLIKKSPTHAPSYYNRGIAKYNLMDSEGACSDFNKAHALGYKKPGLYKSACDKATQMKRLGKFYYEHDKLIPENNYRPKYTRKDTLRGALRPERTCFDVYFYDLSVRIIPKGKKITGENIIYFDVLENTKTIQLDLFENMKIDTIQWKEYELEYSREYNAVFVKFPTEFFKGDKEKIRVVYHGKPRKAPNAPWDGGFDWKKDSTKNLWVGVACEQLGASVWWPNKDHLSDEPDSMSINIEVPDPYKVVSNGNLRKEIHLADDYTRFEWFVSYPINNYDATFYMGNYTSYSTPIAFGKDTLPVDFYVLPYHLEKAKTYFAQTLDVIKFYSEIYGPFPFWKDGFAQAETPFMGMEHQTAIAYGNAFGTDKSREYKNGIFDPIIVHEAAHEWWGNSITAFDMADAWIHEGFATYSEALFLERMIGDEEYLYLIKQYFGRIQNAWPMVENRDVNENSFASGDIYMKGATMLHNLRCTLNNDSVFFGLIKGFYQDHEHSIVTSNQFIEYTNEFTGLNFTPFFNKFLYETDIPVLEYKIKKIGEDLLFSYKWKGVEEGFFMPVGLKTDSEENVRIDVTTELQTTKLKKTDTVRFYSLINGFKGCGKLNYTYFYTELVD